MYRYNSSHDKIWPKIYEKIKNVPQLVDFVPPGVF